jgi:oligopeptide transport system substrate-binding protein
VSDDGLVWTFSCAGRALVGRQPVTAADFVYAFRRLLAPSTAASLAYFMYPLATPRP